MAPIDIRRTYYVVAHFHYVLVAGSLFAMFGGIYYWGEVDRRDVRGNARQDPLLDLAGLQPHLLPMHFLGLAGCRAATPTTPAIHRLQHDRVDRRVRLGLSQVYFFFAVVLPRIRGKGRDRAAASVGGAEGLEWEVPSWRRSTPSRPRRS
jgi:cytochrome c oxidase subunit 1